MSICHGFHLCLTVLFQNERFSEVSVWRVTDQLSIYFSNLRPIVANVFDLCMYLCVLLRFATLLVVDDGSRTSRQVVDQLFMTIIKIRCIPWPWKA